MNDAFITSNHPLLDNTSNYEEELRKNEEYQKALERKYRELQEKSPNNFRSQQQKSATPIWDEINNLTSVMTESEFQIMANDKEFIDSQNTITTMMNNAYMTLVRPIVENNPEGKKALQHHLEVVKKLRKNIADKNAQSMALFQEYTQNYSDMSFNDFMKMKNENKQSK